MDQGKRAPVAQGISPAPVEILYEKGPCLVVLKPAGLLTQAVPGIDSMEVRLKAMLKARDNKTGNIYLGVPHRLDRPVSGAMLFARHVRACRRICDQFADRSVRKVYWACVENIVTPEEGTWEDSVRKIPGEPRSEIVTPDHPEGRTAVLHYRTLGHTQFGSWLEIELETGRTHQIRIQAGSRGFAVLGDAQYGSNCAFGTPHDDVRLRSIALHGRSLAFSHPMTQAKETVSAPLPDTWRALEGLDQLPNGNRLSEN